jgi:hypothetical protein
VYIYIYIAHSSPCPKPCPQTKENIKRKRKEKIHNKYWGIMGNCIRHESSMQWGGEDWGSPEKGGLFAGDEMGKGAMRMEEEKGLIGDDHDSTTGFSSSTTAAKTTEVKIKITRKQLEELLGRVDIKDLSVHQVLAQLMSVSDRYEAHHRSWRPALQSIPEVNWSGTFMYVKRWSISTVYMMMMMKNDIY